MSIKKELVKSVIFALVPITIAIYSSWNLIDNHGGRVISISVIVILALVYIVLLKNQFEQLKNEYDRDIKEHEKKWKNEVTEAEEDLEKRGLTFSGEAVKKLGTMSAYPNQPKGEIENNRDDYIKYRTNKYRLDLTRAKYLVLTNLFKK